MINKILEKRREKLGEQIQDNEIAIIQGAVIPDYQRYFLQDNNFYYFTDLELPDSILLLYKVSGKMVCKIFIERSIPELVVWEGEKVSRTETEKISGIKNVHFLDELNWHLSNVLHGTKKCWMNIKLPNLKSPLKKQHKLMQTIKEKFPAIEFEDIGGLVKVLRGVKDRYELTRMKQAIEHTGNGIRQIMQKAKAGMKEYELEAILVYESMKQGNRHMGFKPIIAAGKNAATLHYVKNNSKINKNDLILLDVGALYKNYNADISRTFPVAGKFTRRQEAVYEEVLQINKTIIKMVKPGISLAQLNDTTIKLITESLFKLKLIKKKEEYRKYYMHGVSHHLGMDTHDPGDRTTLLEPGNVITVEPGIYISEEKIGVRIEDDILVTKTGYENLSISIPKEIPEILEIVNS